ncbi:hypothetical protein T492DRAFT_902002 [Pavlovales sp. CCMP2436]|nr:hypothetical protein T492DRAFT_902002 [Pavlovales sp. CCMP2436]
MTCARPRHALRSPGGGDEAIVQHQRALEIDLALACGGGQEPTLVSMVDLGSGPASLWIIRAAISEAADLVALELRASVPPAGLGHEIWVAAQAPVDPATQREFECALYKLLLARLSALAPIADQRGNTTNSNQQIISLNALTRAHYRRSIGTRSGAQASAAD